VHRSALVIAFVLLTASIAEAESGLASYYGGRGHRNDVRATRPFGSMVRVSYPAAPFIAVSTIVGRLFAAESSMCRQAQPRTRLDGLGRGPRFS
jgi:hypothetical protein